MMKTSQTWRLSVITPAYNEEETIPILYKKLLQVREEVLAQGGSFHWVIVDDHSSDNTPTIVRHLCCQDPGVILIRLSRNCGSHAAISAGLANCEADCAVIMAADLQDPPELIPQLVQAWRRGFDVVWAVRARREKEHWFTRTAAAIYYWLMRKIALPEMPPTGADFLLVSRRVVDIYNQIPEKHTSVFALIQWLGFPATSISYVKEARRFGTSKWTLAKKIKLFVDSIVSFSFAPIRWISAGGLIMLLVGVLFGIAGTLAELAGMRLLEIGSLLIVAILLAGHGAVLLALGILGEYLYRVFDQVRGRPHYVIQEVVSAARTNGLQTSDQKQCTMTEMPKAISER